MVIELQGSASSAALRDYIARHAALIIQEHPRAAEWSVHVAPRLSRLGRREEYAVRILVGPPRRSQLVCEADSDPYLAVRNAFAFARFLVAASAPPKRDSIIRPHRVCRKRGGLATAGAIMR